MEEWVYQLFLKTGNIHAYLLLKELSRGTESGVSTDNGTDHDGGGCYHQGI